MADEQDGGKRSSLKTFCCNHIKSIVTVIMVFGMVFCVVMIVMVHKWNFETNEAKYLSGCLDVAIIGAGLSGSYAAFKMKDLGYKIQVFEMSNRTGGMLHTISLPDFPDLNLDVGVMSYVAKDQPHLDHLIHALQLPPRTSPRLNQDPPTFFLRNKLLTVADLSTSHSPYHLGNDEAGKNPEELTQHYQKMLLGDNWYSLSNSKLSLSSKDGLNLYKQGYQNTLGKVASSEGMNFLHDSARWGHLASNDNAAKLLFSPWDHLEWGFVPHKSLEGGMQSLPETLMEHFLNASSRHSLNLNHRLACIRIKHGVYQLIFVKTKNDLGNVRDIRESAEFCAHKVIVAVPQKAHKKIEWKPFDSEFKYKQSLNSLQEYPVIRVFFTFAQLWIPRMDRKDIYTDLPIKHCKYMGEYANSDSSNNRHVFMVAEVDGSNLDYIRSLIDLKSFDGNNMYRYKCNETSYLVADIKRQLAKLYNVDVGRIPNPEDVVILDWTRNKGTGSWYNWKRGAQWEEIDRNMTKPQSQEEVYFVGGLLRDTMDNVLKHVDHVIGEYFNSTALKTA